MPAKRGERQGKYIFLACQDTFVTFVRYFIPLLLPSPFYSLFLPVGERFKGKHSESFHLSLSLSLFPFSLPLPLSLSLIIIPDFTVRLKRGMVDTTIIRAICLKQSIKKRKKKHCNKLENKKG